MRLAVVVALALAASSAAAHHVGTYTARDNELTQNFKQLKSALQARKYDVAVRLYDDGVLRRELLALGTRVPAHLETATREALRTGDVRRAEAGIAAVFAALARDLAGDAKGKLADTSLGPDARRTAGTRFLEAMWRYWALIDYVVSQHDARAAVAVRLAFDEIETLTRGGTAPPDGLAVPLGRINETLTGVVQTLALATRRDS